MIRRGIGVAALLLALATAGCTTAPSEPPASSAPSSVMTTVPTVTPSATPEPTPTTSAPVPTTRAQTVTPLVTYSGFDTLSRVVEVSSFVPELAESNGTCTLSIEGSDGWSTEGPAIADAHSMQCGSLFIEIPNGVSGTLTAYVEYESGTNYGRSSPVTISVES